MTPKDGALSDRSCPFSPFDLSPREVMISTGPLPWRSIKWMTFQYPEPNYLYVAMIRDRTRLQSHTEDQQQETEPRCPNLERHVSSFSSKVSRP
jgi:hypothetical protein